MKRIFADSSILIAGAASKTGASRAVLTMAALTELVRSVKKDSVLIGDFNLPDINC